MSNLTERQDLLLTYATILSEKEIQESWGEIGIATATGVGAATLITKALLGKKKCKKMFPNNPEKLRNCINKLGF